MLNDAITVTSDKVNTLLSIPGCTSRRSENVETCRNALVLTAGGGPAHLEFEAARLGRIADRADSDTDHLPQHDAADRGEATALGHRLALTESFTHTNKAKSATARLRG